MLRIAHCVVLLALFGFLADSSVAAGAAQVTWQTDLKQAVHEAGRSQKPLLVEFTASWCGYCRKMKQTTFADERIAKHVNGCFVPVSIDADQHERLMRTVGVEALPTTVILSHDLRVVRKIAGYQTAEQLEEELGTVCAHDEAALSPVSLEPIPEPVATGESSAVQPLASAPAFDKLCLVSLRDDHRLRTGKTAFSTTYRGRRLCFASTEKLHDFEENPELYWPELDGACVVSAIDEGADLPGAGREALVFRGRIWLFADRERRERFFENAADYADRVVEAQSSSAVEQR